LRLLKFNEDREEDEAYSEITDAEYLENGLREKMQSYRRTFRDTANKVRSSQFHAFRE